MISTTTLNVTCQVLAKAQQPVVKMRVRRAGSAMNASQKTAGLKRGNMADDAGYEENATGKWVRRD